MSKRKAYARISCTLPEDVLAEADRIAAREDRSRSWVIAEALRRYESPTPGTARLSMVRESAAPGYAAEAVADARVRRLQYDLTLTPGERLARAEQLMELAQAVRPRPARAQVIGFETLEDFAAWKAARRIRQ
jgi:hypothetical protein